MEDITYNGLVTDINKVFLITHVYIDLHVFSKITSFFHEIF